MRRTEQLQLADDIEVFVSKKIDIDTFDKYFHKVVKILSDRHKETYEECNIDSKNIKPF